MNLLLASLRTTAATMLVCVVGYSALVWGLAQTFAPANANGSLVTDASGRVVGSSQIAQAFTEPRYFWPRPSAVDYDGAGAGGSNLSPTSEALAERAEAIVAAYGATDANPLPADLAAASGAGLDPHISLDGALYQVERVAGVRSLDPETVRRLVAREAFAPGAPLGSEPVVNVLDLNLALDTL